MTFIPGPITARALAKELKLGKSKAEAFMAVLEQRAVVRLPRGPYLRVSLRRLSARQMKEIQSANGAE